MNDFLFGILEWIQSWLGSYGWAMVVFTVLIRLVLTPLDIKSRTSMRKTTKLQPQLNALQKKYANDKEKLNQKTAELYRKEHINPLSSCLPLLLTWPILIAVFAAMRTAANKELLMQLTQILNNEKPQLETWLWVRNLWMPDSLFSSSYPDLNTLRMIPADQWQKWFDGLESVPVLIRDLNLTAESFSQSQLATSVEGIVKAMAQNTDYVNAISTRAGWTFSLLGLTTLSVPNEYNGLMLLPILSAVSQIVMTKVTGAMSGGQNSQANSQAASTSKMMNWFFPIFSLVICFSYSSAFALYWVAGNVVSLVQTLAINYVLDRKEKAAEVAGEGTVK